MEQKSLGLLTSGPVRKPPRPLRSRVRERAWDYRPVSLLDGALDGGELEEVAPRVLEVNQLVVGEALEVDAAEQAGRPAHSAQLGGFGVGTGGATSTTGHRGVLSFNLQAKKI